ncbi:hypothetical protein BDP27DRAFT_1424359 [Rhodocollybia butyracea]|uniref:Uncharacterized protein n=1 Tax=Rhodocollybia butyracea TaxID=206335 RepID=A0A9P5U4I5_9AGAR|nr:hypothetical protein BDP27DRAFT_1424359 [Rhodocollybia butyracea]
MDIDEQQLWLIFEPLLELQRLEYLDYQIILPLSDQKTARIACAWPHLKDLCFNSAVEGSSLESLAYFARHCPDLESLYCPIQVETRVTPSTTIPPTLFPHALHTFGANHYREIDALSAPVIALGLYQIFPNLVCVKGIGLGWTLVQNTLDSFTFLRNQNRQLEK